MHALRHCAARARRTAAFLALAAPCLAAGPPDAPPVVVATTELRELVEQVPVSGTVRSPRVAQLSPEVAGRVAQVLIDAGDHVAAGAPLLRLDTALARLALQAAEAAVDQAREELADARRRLDDVRRLASGRSIAETQVRALETEVRGDAATLRLREAERDSAAERLRRHDLSAPFEGVISRKLTEAGEWVAPGDAVLELLADQGLRVEFRVPQAYFPSLAPGTAVDVEFDALPGRRLAARIGEIVPVSDPSARTFLIRVYPDDPSLPLTPGMSARGTLGIRSGEHGVMVARDALLRHPDGRVTAWVIEGDEAMPTVTERQVHTGLAFDGLVAVRSGLEAGTRVVVEGNEALRQSQRVNIRAER